MPQILNGNKHTINQLITRSISDSKWQTHILIHLDAVPSIHVI